MSNQLNEAREARALKRAGLHHISLRQGRTAQGIKGTARLIASVVVAMPYVLADLEGAPGQRVVELSLSSAGARHKLLDPLSEPRRFPYWR